MTRYVLLVRAKTGKHALLDAESRVRSWRTAREAQKVGATCGGEVYAVEGCSLIRGEPGYEEPVKEEARGAEAAADGTPADRPQSEAPGADRDPAAAGSPAGPLPELRGGVVGVGGLPLPGVS